MRLNDKSLKPCFNYWHTLITVLCLGSCIALAAPPSELRGERYCEIILSKGLTNYTVYNTLGLNTCPENIWKKVNSNDIKSSTQATFVHLNGPRFWVVDGYQNADLSQKTVTKLGGLSLRQSATLNIKMMHLLKANSPYYKHEVARQIEWHYRAGKPVYELIDPRGQVYVMQSYSIQKKHLSEPSLAQLGTMLTLPAGWVFKTGILPHPEILKTSNNQAIVVQDNLDNTYQKATHDFLKPRPLIAQDKT